MNYSIQCHLSTIDKRLCTQSKCTVCTWLTILYRFTWHLAAAPGCTDLTYQRPYGALCRLEIWCGMMWVRGTTEVEDQDKFTVYCKRSSRMTKANTSQPKVTICSVFGHLGTVLVKQNLDELGRHLGSERPNSGNTLQWRIFNELVVGSFGMGSEW